MIIRNKINFIYFKNKTKLKKSNNNKLIKFPKKSYFNLMNNLSLPNIPYLNQGVQYSKLGLNFARRFGYKNIALIGVMGYVMWEQ